MQIFFGVYADLRTLYHYIRVSGLQWFIPQKLKFRSLMKKREKQEWIMDYIRNCKFQHVDIFDSEFVDAYIEACNPQKVIVQPYGAHTVPEIGKYMSELYRMNILNRVPIGLSQCYSGFPKWCYSYYLRKGNNDEHKQ